MAYMRLPSLRASLERPMHPPLCPQQHRVVARVLLTSALHVHLQSLSQTGCPRLAASAEPGASLLDDFAAAHESLGNVGYPAVPETGGLLLDDLGATSLDKLGCLAEPDLGGLLLEDPWAEPELGTLGCPAPGDLGVPMEELRDVVLLGPLLPACTARSSAISPALGRDSWSPVHLTTRSAISWGASSGTLHAQCLSFKSC